MNHINLTVIFTTVSLLSTRHSNTIMSVQCGQRRYFYIVSQFCGKVIDVSAGNCGNNVTLYSKQQCRNQLWYMDQQGFIRSAFNDSFINAAPNDKAVVVPCNGGQQWVFECNRIVNRANCQVLDVYQRQTSDGTKIISWPYKGTPNQHWRLEYV